MSRFTDRIPAAGKAGMVRIKNVVNSGNEITGILELADDATVQGTILNAANLNQLETDLKTYTDNACSQVSSAASLPISGGTMSGNLNMMANNIEFQGSDSGDLVWYNSGRSETDRIYAPSGSSRKSLYYSRNGTYQGSLMLSASTTSTKLGFYIRTSNISADSTVTVTASNFGLSKIFGIVAMTRKTSVGGYPGVLITWSNSDTSWVIACDRDSCNGFYAIAWGE